jgi:N-acetylglutamate synthase-like GNAT family acetyltransferase
MMGREAPAMSSCPAQNFLNPHPVPEIGVAGVVGLERYGEVALLRSLVVTSQHLGRGLGRRLVAAAEVLATELTFPSIYLLTTSAEPFFEYMGSSHPPAAIQKVPCIRWRLFY